MDYSDMATELQEARDNIRESLMGLYGFYTDSQHYDMRDVTEMAVVRNSDRYFELMGNIINAGQSWVSRKDELLAEAGKEFAEFMEPFIQDTIDSIIASHLEV